MNGEDGDDDNDDQRDYPYYNGLPPHQAHSDTSKAAAIDVMMDGSADSDRKMIFDFIVSRGLVNAAGEGGATRDECQVKFGLLHQTNTGRIAELVQAGRIIDSGFRRKTRRHKDAEVLVVAPPGTPPQIKGERRTVPKGFTDAELVQLYLSYRAMCERDLAHQKRTDKDAELDPLIIRLGYWLRENGGPIANGTQR